MTTATSVRTKERLDPKLLPIGLVLIAAPILANIDATSVGVATNTIATHFRASLADVQWVSTSYLLAMAVVMPLSGWLSERFGSKRMWILAVALFTAGSMLCGLAWSLPTLIIFRIIQALGGGLMNPIGQSIIAQAAGPSRIGRVMSLLVIPVTFAPIVGPIVGGVLVQGLDWRWIFYINLPICLIALPFAARLLPDDRATLDPKQRLDIVGFILLSPGLVSIVYGFSTTTEDTGTGSSLTMVSLSVGAVLVLSYIVYALRTRGVPLIDLRLFARRGFGASSATSFLLGASVYSSMVLLPLFYQQIEHADVLRAGLFLAPQAFGTAVGAFFAGRLTDKYGPRFVVIAGILLALVGTVAFTQVDMQPPAWLLTGSLIVRGIGLGAVMGPNIAAVYTSVEKHQAPRAASAVTVLNRVGGSFGTAILIVVLQNQLSGQSNQAAAYGMAFWLTLVLSVLTLIPALLFSSRAKKR